MSKLSEADIEQHAIKLLEEQGYHYIYGPDIAPDGCRPERPDYGEVLLTARLEKAVRRINPKLPLDVLQAAIKELQRINSPELLVNNETFHRLLTEGGEGQHPERW